MTLYWIYQGSNINSRFIINVPPEELTSIQRVCFQVEQAHWFYQDFCREVNPKLPNKTLKQFALLMFGNCSLLSHWVDEFELAYQTFLEYKTRVPVCGCIMLNPKLTKVVLVRGWKSNSGWGFPKGKINQGEREVECAIREVFEECGHDISSLVREEEYIERRVNEQRIRLYIVVGVDEKTEFLTQTRKEIGVFSLIGYQVS